MDNLSVHNLISVPNQALLSDPYFKVNPGIPNSATITMVATKNLNIEYTQTFSGLKHHYQNPTIKTHKIPKKNSYIISIRVSIINQVKNSFNFINWEEALPFCQLC